MKLNKQTLKRIIKEEIQATLRESMPSGGTDYYNKLVTLMRTKAGVYQSESLYEFARGQLAPDEQTFLDNCFKLLELGREALKLHNAIAEISKQIVKYLEDNEFRPWQHKRRENDVFLQELETKRREMREQIKDLNLLFNATESILDDLADPTAKSPNNPLAYAARAAIEAGLEEAGGLFGMLSI